MSLLKNEQKNHLYFYLAGLLPIIIFVIMLKPCANLFEWSVKSGQYNITEKADKAARFYETTHIPPGKFMMGKEDENPDESPRHQVTLSTGFFIMKKEVTRELYALVMNTEISINDGCLINCPINRVSWEEAIEFADALSKLEKRDECYSLAIQNCNGWRLPTEAEWELAAGGKFKHRFSGSNFREEVGWHQYNSEGKLHSGCEKTENKIGLCDMSGNVWEWTQDWYGEYPNSEQIDPTGPATGTKKVIRGGSWTGPYMDMTITNRNALVPTTKNRGLGFRLVRSSR